MDTTIADILAERGIPTGPPAPRPPMVETPEEAAARHAQAAANRRALFDSVRPRAYASASLSDLTADQHRDVIAAWLDSDSPLLLLVGDSGVGKSHAGWAVGAAAVDRGVSVYGGVWADVLRSLRPNPSDPDSPRRVWQRATECGLFVGDDLGREQRTEWSVEQVYTLIETRLSACRRSVIITNHGSGEIEARYGSPVADRLDADSTILRFTGESRRRPRQW